MKVKDKEKFFEDTEELKMERIWAMPNKWTFTIKPIKELLKEEVTQGLWIDPFAGQNSPATITNDLNPDNKADYHLDAIEFLKMQPDNSADGILLDPPYSNRQVSEHYKEAGIKVTGWHTSAGWTSTIKDEAARILKPNGKVICFGWTSMGLGINRGFEMQRILLVPHGGSKNDTICTVETKK
jgi:hypothetical protein